MKVELIYHHECPHVEGARANLLGALTETGIAVRWTEWEHSSPETPRYAREYGSPIILVNGQDVEDLVPAGELTSCRIYGQQRVPSAELIRSMLLNKSGKQKSGWNQHIATLTGIAVALLPKVACPACWPIYASVVSFMGLGLRALFEVPTADYGRVLVSRCRITRLPSTRPAWLWSISFGRECWSSSGSRQIRL